MKYENKEQIKNLLLRSKIVVLNTSTNNVYFSGETLDRCYLKVDTEVLKDILTVCRILGIQRHII